MKESPPEMPDSKDDMTFYLKRDGFILVLILRGWDCNGHYQSRRKMTYDI